ncbi:MAG: hypothetical protein ACKVWV_10720 [Planctomycetota bacterium]
MSATRPVPWLRALALFCLVCASGCMSSRPEPGWVRAPVVPASDRVLWEVTALALEKTGFPIGSGFEPGSRSGTSGWRMSLAPFKGKGFREQCVVRFAPSGPDDLTAEVRVIRDKNDDVSHPLDPSYADWKPEPDNVVRAQIVLQYIQSMLGTPAMNQGRPATSPASAPARANG